VGIRKFSLAIAVVTGLAAVVATGEPVRSETLTVGAVHSLKASFQEIVPMFEKEYGATVHVVYGRRKRSARRLKRERRSMCSFRGRLRKSKNYKGRD
jgi:ABC-type molybdate transport system substrate-binding protein